MVLLPTKHGTSIGTGRPTSKSISASKPNIPLNELIVTLHSLTPIKPCSLYREHHFTSRYDR